MDLCLRGSQINLATRQKPKPKYSSQTNLHSLQTRPRSATFFHKRSRSSPFLCRPQSADPKFGRNIGSACGQYCGENDFSRSKYEKNKRFQSVSSSNLLKLLLDEPIKRSWLCRGNTGGTGGGSSPDEQSELGSSRKSTSYGSFNKRTRTESVGGSSAEGEHTERNLRLSRRTSASSSATRMSSGSSLSSLSKDKYVASMAGKSLTSSDYWLNMPSGSGATQKSAKPDLPGRVSFCKPTTQNDLDYSDCDNDKQEQFTTNTQPVDDISAPGPLKMPSFAYDPPSELTPVDHVSSAGLKKSVHFGGSGAGEHVLAETYEYPKCPSENCSCSTRSSSTASIHETLEPKCACDSATCKYMLEASRRHSQSLLVVADVTDATAEKAPPPPPVEDSAVIREYKNAIGEQLENSIVKNILEEGQSYSTTTLNNVEVPAYLEKYASPTKSELNLEKQNNLSEPKTALPYKTAPKRNLLSNNSSATLELTKSSNNLDNNLKMQATFTNSSESVINNYLKVAATTPLVSKKKENNKPSSADTNGLRKAALPPANSSVALNKPKSSTNLQRAKLKKSTSFGNLREDSNLSEFNLDKVDSWMSMHEQTLTQKTLTKHASLDVELEKFNKESLTVALDSAEAVEEEDEVGADSGSQMSAKSDSADDSTYDEIVSVIKEIEEDKKKDNYAERGSSELELKLNTPTELSETVTGTTASIKHEKSADKFKDILNYLDNVEDSCDKTLLETRRSMPDSNRSEVEFVVEPDIAEDVPKLSDLLMLPNHQLARRIVALSLRANELANAVYLSKEHVLKIRTEKQKSIRSEKANSANRLREQKKHYETIVKRHQGFIEQLLKDKGSLCEKVAALTRRLESQNQAWEHKLETELARAKETTLAGEKIRRERWVRENTKKIKELTVKGLETEINKMTCNHQQEVNELKRAHQQQLLDALEEARIKHEQIENSIRESCAQDRESIIEKERTAIRERFERQLEEERKSFDEQKQKLLEDLTSERERLKTELKKKEAEHQNRRQEIQREKEEELEQAISELQEKMSKQDEKYQNRINTIEKQYEADFEIWKQEYANSCKVAQVEKENIIRQHYRAERDRQIDAIVSRMDAEAQKNAEEYDAKLSRLKEKYEKDLQETENVEKSLREKFTDTRGKLAESDAQVRNFEAELKQLQIELEHSKKMCNDFLAERDQLRDNLRNEIQSEVSSLKVERDNEIQKIHKRVQQAIEKKDTTIDILQKENGTLRERCLKLEAVIRQQRKDYCVK